MQEVPLYQEIAESIRAQILSGQVKPGTQLPSIRALTQAWSCTPGTVQHAYRLLAEQGLVISRPGQGTHVAEAEIQEMNTAVRRLSLVHRAEAFVLQARSVGYSLEDIEAATLEAMERWRVASSQPSGRVQGVLRFSGSHDPGVAWLAAHFPSIAPGWELALRFTGSLGGLIALAEGQADLAGCHLWDAETGAYNLPFVRRLLPGQQAALLTVAHRRLGLILLAGNPLSIHEFGDLFRPGVRFVNRQAGSGTRIWLDAALHSLGLEPQSLRGYEIEKITHSEVAAAVADGQADAGFGLQTAALAYGLDFIELVREPYELVIPMEVMQLEATLRLVEWLSQPDTRQGLQNLGGYDVQESGHLRSISGNSLRIT